MKVFHRWLIAVLLMLCLPVQGMAAVALPIGMTHETLVAAVHVVADDTTDHCKQHAHEEAAPEMSSPACDHCFSCHLSIAQALMPAGVLFQPVQAAQINSPALGEKVALLTFPVFRPPISA